MRQKSESNQRLRCRLIMITDKRKRFLEDKKKIRTSQIKEVSCLFLAFFQWIPFQTLIFRQFPLLLRENNFCGDIDFRTIKEYAEGLLISLEQEDHLRLFLKLYDRPMKKTSVGEWRQWWKLFDRPLQYPFPKNLKLFYEMHLLQKCFARMDLLIYAWIMKPIQSKMISSIVPFTS